jgi:hypothetical protein
MDKNESMNIKERRKYLAIMWPRYRTAEKREKSKLLDEMERVTGLHRKSLIRVIKGRLSRKKRERERGKEYGIAEEDVIRKISRSLDYPCAERLQPNLVWMTEQLVKHGEITVKPGTMEKLERISISTLKRMLKRMGREDTKMAFRKPQQSRKNHLRKAYPMKRIPWDTPEPGHFEVDLVWHCGEDGRGDFIHTMQMVDVATGWSEIAAVYGRSYKAIQDGFQAILGRLPFPVKEIHPDNGSEFFNDHIIRYWKQKIEGLELTRSRPYHKNDNRFVEENNNSLIRAYLGYSRYNTIEQLNTIRRLYQYLWIYHNLFQPVMRTEAKEYLDPMHYRRVFDQALPPLDRLIKCNVLDEATASNLLLLRDQTNPIHLREDIECLISDLYQMPINPYNLIINVKDTLYGKELVPWVTLSNELSFPVQ